MITLFLVSFIAATLWPMASEAYVVYLVTNTAEHYLLIWLVATVANALGSITMFELARCSASWVEGKLQKEKLKRPNLIKNIRRYGTPSLFFAWLPLIGDALPLMAGALNFKRCQSYAWIISGKAVRYAIIILGVLTVVGLP